MRRLAIAGLLVASSAHADPTPAISTEASPAPPASGLAIGAELGEPTSATIGWFGRTLAATAALGSGTFAGPGVSAHADVALVVARPTPALAIRVGLGGRFYHHGYTRMSPDELPDSHVGVRASASAAVERGAVQLYAELAPGIDVFRTNSCTLADGPGTICPHAQASPLFLQFDIGVRWFLSH